MSYFAADMDHEATLNRQEEHDALVDYIRDMADGCIEECVTWCPFRDGWGLCPYTWPDCKLNRMRKEAP